MKVAITAKSLEAALCLIFLAQNYLNGHNTADMWEHNFRNFKDGDVLESYIKSHYSQIREEPDNLEYYINTLENTNKTVTYKRRKEEIEIYDINKVGELYS